MGDYAERRAVFDRDRRMAVIDDQCRRADAAADAASREQAAQAADENDAKLIEGWMRQLRGEPVPTLQDMLDMSRNAEDGPGRDPSAPVGSELNPARFVGETWVAVDLPPVVAKRSPDDALLGRARQLGDDAFMRDQGARFRARRGGREVSRSTPSGEVFCLDCIELNAAAEESILIHAEPDAPPPRTVPDYAPRRSRRASGTGWPSQVPMIYR